MAVYFIAARELGLVKIGYSADPKKRLGKVATDCPCDVELVGVADGGKTREAEIHQALSHARQGGEWFRLTSDVEAFIDGYRLPEGVRFPLRRFQPLSAYKNSLHKYLHESGETVSAFAERVRLSRVSVSRIKGGRQRPSWDAAQRIAIATGGRVPVESWAKPDEAA